MFLLEPLAWVLALAVAIPWLVLALECFAALIRPSPAPVPDATDRPTCVVLIPAHNEELVLSRTLQSVLRQVTAQDRVLVVADNCTDGTAELGRSFGAGVVERTDAVRRGKGYALAFGRDVLLQNPPNVVVVLDADCTMGDHTLHRLVIEAVRRQRPVQAAYLMTAPEGAGLNRRVAALAFLIKNVIRPLGLSRLGCPCLLTGTGMAFPWAVFRDAPLAHGHIVEDMGLTVDLALRGQKVKFLYDAQVQGEFPIDNQAAGSQRRRWEHGHLKVILSGVPRLLIRSLAPPRLSLVALAFEIGVPPLSALVLATCLVWIVLAVSAGLSGVWGPVAVLGSAVGLGALGLSCTWWRYGRSTLPLRAAVLIPFYVLRKLALYGQFFVRPQREWVRTERDNPPPM
jgi:cellulose synthase/poly-beta-1,6-N-acetylglucosamine synthase-like glycosyltransferase